MKFEIQADKPLVQRRVESARYVAVAIGAPEAPRKHTRAPVSMALVLDRSGSMRGEKLDRAKAAGIHAIRTLATDDQFCVITYDDNVTVLVPSGPATLEHRRLAEQRLAAVEAGNTTALFDGWRTGCEELAKQLGRDALGRCLLLTDGLANCGLTDREAIAGHVAQQRQRGVSTSTFGVGADFDEAMLQQVSAAGGGNFYFIADAKQIPDFIASEIGEVLEVVIPGAVLTVCGTANIEVRSLNDFPVARQGETWRVELGSLVSAQLLDPMLAIVFPPGQSAGVIELQIGLEDRNGSIVAPGCTLRFESAPAAEVAAYPAVPEIARQVARLLAAKASQESLELNRDGRYAEARALLECLAKQILDVADGDSVQLEIATELEAKAREYAQPMDLMARKLRYYEEYRGLKNKALAGRARRANEQAAVNPSVTGEVVVLATTPELAAVTRFAVKALNQCASNPFELAVSDALISTHGAPRMDVLTHADESALVVEATRLCSAAKLRIVLTGRGLADHWFSHAHPLAATTVVSVDRWSELSTAPLEAFIAYEIIIQGLAVLAPNYRVLDLVHEDTRGCLWDLCPDRTTIGDKLRRAGICEDCRTSLGQLGLAEQLVRELLTVMHSLATA